MGTDVDVGAGVGAGADAKVFIKAIYRRRIEAAAPNLVLAAPCRILRSPTSQFKTILKALQVLYFNT
jgi:hypothetical protein